MHEQIEIHVMEAVKGLRLPSCYVEVTDNEMEYLDGKIAWVVVLKCILKTVGAIGVGVAARIATYDACKNSIGLNQGWSITLGIVAGVGSGIAVWVFA